jgi:hypothetical protein
MIIKRPMIESEPEESNQELCKYTEYDQESGETYACSLPLYHKEKHKRGRRL